MNKAPEQSYEEYKKAQIARAENKWSCPPFWKSFDGLFKPVIDEINKQYGVPESICCMGIRNGNEYFGFKELLGFKNTVMYGVDIHPKVATVGPNCFCYDFNELPKEWEKKFTWVYSNALDHAFDVQKTLKEWHRVCKDYMILLLPQCGMVSSSDVYDFEVKDVPTLFDTNLFEVVKVWDQVEQYKSFTVLLKIK